MNVKAECMDLESLETGWVVLTAHRPDKKKQTFAVEFSRELRAPLTVFTGYLEWLQSQSSDDHLVAVERMYEQVRQMEALLDDMRKLSRLRQSRSKNLNEKVNMPAILTQLKEQAEEMSAGDHALDFQIQQELYIKGNARDLECASWSLIDNAINYSPGGGSVEVSWQKADQSILLSVRDTGMGIPQHDIPRLTEHFYRGANATAQDIAGSGLGLVIVQQVIDSHQAQLRVQSEEGKGSWFICEFPIERLA